VGRNLLAYAKQWAVGQGFRQIDVRTQECNSAARALYSAAGFAPAGSESVGHLWLPA
jgi:GNAT superfamily N-acetyltransferase